MRMVTGKDERTIADRISDPNRPTWEQYKKENADKLDLNGNEEKAMREYRKKLDASREKVREAGAVTIAIVCTRRPDHVAVDRNWLEVAGLRRGRGNIRNTHARRLRRRRMTMTVARRMSADARSIKAARKGEYLLGGRSYCVNGNG